MVDPYAPPEESAANRPPRPLPYVEPYASVTGQTYQQAYEPPPLHDAPRERDRPWRRSEHEPRTEPAKPGLFWTVAVVGIGLVCLARLMLFFVLQDNLPGEQVAPALFATLGVIALSVGLSLAGLLQRGLAVPWRIALVAAGGFFAVAGAFPAGGLVGLF